MGLQVTLGLKGVTIDSMKFSFKSVKVNVDKDEEDKEARLRANKATERVLNVDFRKFKEKTI